MDESLEFRLQDGSSGSQLGIAKRGSEYDDMAGKPRSQVH